MTDLTTVFDTFFISAVCLFWNEVKWLLVAGVFSHIFRGLCRLLL